MTRQMDRETPLLLNKPMQDDLATSLSDRTIKNLPNDKMQGFTLKLGQLCRELQTQ